MGYSPALGFIHTGNMLSFVYDIADLYKTEITIQASFEVVGDKRNDPNYLERNVRMKCRDYFKKVDIMKRVVKDLKYILDDDTTNNIDTYAGALWTPEGDIAFAKNYGDRQ